MELEKTEEPRVGKERDNNYYILARFVTDFSPHSNGNWIIS
jgi:hypothetical protein